MTIKVTINSLKNDYADYLQKANPKISPRAPNSYWDIQAGAMAAILLDYYGNLQLLENAIYPQNAVGDQVDLWLYTRGLTARGGETYTTINVTMSSGILPITIPANTIFTDSTTLNSDPTGQQYQTLTDITITSNTDIFTLYAIQPGPNYLEPIGNILTATIPPTTGTTYQVTTQSCANGRNMESDRECIARILASIRAPRSGSRTTDYFQFCLEANVLLPIPVITDAIILPGFQVLNGIYTFGVFPLVGNKITEYQLNQGLLPSTSFIPYSRTPATDVLTVVDNYIQNQRLVGLAVTALSNYTFIVAGTNTSPPYNISNLQQPPIISPNLQINVTLAEGYQNSTIVNINSQDQNGNPIVIQLTVTQLIQRETRRAICNQPFGATPENANYNIIPASTIITTLNYQLGINGGQLAKILTNIQLPNGDIPVPLYTQFVQYLFYTYDIEDYNNIIIGSI